STALLHPSICMYLLSAPPRSYTSTQTHTLPITLSRSIKKSRSKMAPTYCWTSSSLGLFAKGFETRVPTQITCQTFKEHPRALGLGKGPKVYVNRCLTECLAHSLAAPAASRPGLQGARSIAPIGGLSTHGSGEFRALDRGSQGLERVSRSAGAAAVSRRGALFRVLARV